MTTTHILAGKCLVLFPDEKLSTSPHLSRQDASGSIRLNNSRVTRLCPETPSDHSDNEINHHSCSTRQAVSVRRGSSSMVSNKDVKSRGSGSTQRPMTSNHFALVNFPQQKQIAALPPIEKCESGHEGHHDEQFSTGHSNDQVKMIKMQVRPFPDIKVTDGSSTRPLRANYLNSTGTSDHFDIISVDKFLTPRTNVFPPRGGSQRRQSFAGGFRLNPSSFDMDKIKHKYARTNSVGVSHNIHEQFREALRGPRLSIDIKQTDDCPVIPISHEKKRTSLMGYKLRHEYGKNIEKTWFFNEYMKKRSNKRFASDHNHDFRKEMFYSPEPKTDVDIETSDIETDDVISDATSMMCGGASTKGMTGRNKVSLKTEGQDSTTENQLEQYRLTDDDENSSGSDIEIIFKDNQLIQRKTKHRLRMKRRRQIKRYRPFLKTETTDDSTEQSSQNLQLTDIEIRALRLNLQPKDKVSNLRGKRRFLQIANAIYIAVQFRSILKKIRNRKRLVMKAKQQRIAKMVAKRLKREQCAILEESKYERTSKPTLKDIFLKEMGQKLIFDIARLRISDQVDDEAFVDMNDSDDESTNDDDNDNNSALHSRGQISKPQMMADADAAPRPSKYELELKRVSLRDLKRVNKQLNNGGTKPKKYLMYRKRRHSVPKMARPSEFLMTITKKYRRQPVRKDTKHVDNRRASNVLTPRCMCQTERIINETRHDTKTSSCQHKAKKAERASRRTQTRTVVVNTRGLMRTHSLDDLSRKRPIELEDLLKDIQIPAKEIRLQILRRRFRRQRHRRQRIRLSPVRLPERPRFDPRSLIADELSSTSATGSEMDTVDEGDLENKLVFMTPFVGTGVTWNKNARDENRRTWTNADVEREVKRITRVFRELKECRYLRPGEFHQAVMKRLSKHPA